ncbi:MAG: nuclear transport factor 2 family protein [Bacteroidales bacterium]|nr:nuclear transport factor 2 family protein [Bacteroidales bacterium]
MNTREDREKKAIVALYEKMYRAMMAKDTSALGSLLTDDSILIHMTGHRHPRKEYLDEIASGVLNYYSVETDSIMITVDGDKARMTGRSRVNASVYGGGRHTWRLQMDSRLIKTDEGCKISLSKASTY